MRDPNRIEPFLKELGTIWKENYPDWRFGQFMINMFSQMKIDPFFPEEDDFLKILKDIINDKH